MLKEKEENFNNEYVLKNDNLKKKKKTQNKL